MHKPNLKLVIEMGSLNSLLTHTHIAMYYIHTRSNAPHTHMHIQYTLIIHTTLIIMDFQCCLLFQHCLRLSNVEKVSNSKAISLEIHYDQRSMDYKCVLNVHVCMNCIVICEYVVHCYVCVRVCMDKL